jgi:hypothetical protein
MQRQTVRRTRLLTGIFVLLAGLASLTPLPAAAAEAAGDAFTTFVLGPDGAVYSWRTGDSALGPLPPTLARLGARPVNDLEVSGDGGTMVVLVASSPQAGSRHRRNEGSALVVSIPPPPALPWILSEIAFDGEGRGVEVSPDGRQAYVLALRAGTDAPAEPTRTWLHALDLIAGKVESSAQIDRPPGAIALDPAAARLYLAYAGRIVSYTTHPLARSWHYRSPGANRGLYFRPRSAVLHAVRMGHVALFDPAIIAALRPEDRQKREDDATALVSLSFTADSLLFSRDGLLAAAAGPGNILAFLDPGTARVLATSEDAAIDPDREMRPFYFAAGPGDLVVASFPDKEVRLIHPPAVALGPDARSPQVALEAAPSAPPAPAPSATLEPAPSATPEPAPSPGAAPTTAIAGLVASVPEATPTPARGPVLAGRLTGSIGAVRSIVVYGPGSIVLEQARATPGSDGVWQVSLPPPGIYRIVPLGEGSRALRCEPNFLTVEVKDQGRNDLDFRIVGTS